MPESMAAQRSVLVRDLSKDARDGANAPKVAEKEISLRTPSKGAVCFSVFFSEEKLTP